MFWKGYDQVVLGSLSAGPYKATVRLEELARYNSWSMSGLKSHMFNGPNVVFPNQALIVGRLGDRFEPGRDRQPRVSHYRGNPAWVLVY